MSHIIFKNKLLIVQDEIEKKIENKNLNYFFEYLEKNYKIEIKEIKYYFKRRISENFSRLEPSKYNKNIFKRNNIKFIKSIILYFLIKFIIFFKKTKKKYNLQTKILVDDIQNINELNRMVDLLSKFKKEEVVFIKRKNFKHKNKNIVFILQEDLRNYSEDILKKYFSVINLYESYLLFKYSIVSKIDLFEVYKNFLNDFLYYNTLFSKIKGKVIVQERILGRTNVVKNYLFKKIHNGRNCYLQTHIFPYDTQSLFFNCDVFFSMGINSYTTLQNFNAKINQVIPIGSHSLNYSLFKNKTFKDEEKILSNISSDLDVLFIGSNVGQNNRNNWEGYYKTIKWLQKISIEKKYNIYIKHHPSWKKDNKEIKIVKNSKIKYLPNNLDSYFFALKAKVLITYCSTMGYELIPLKKIVYFTDPLDNNNFLNDEIEKDNIVIKSFEDLINCIESKNYILNSQYDDYGLDYKNTKLYFSKNINKMINTN